MRKRISLSIRLFEEAQKCLSSMPLLLLMPIATFLFLMMFIIYWILTLMMIYSYGIFSFL
jgi:solute carrier family 44 protein 1 (choline transporter-like protein)